MAKNKTRKKSTPAKSQRQRAKERAAAVIKRIGYRMGFLGGMAWLDTQVIGMQEAVAGNTSVQFKEMLADELQSNLRNIKREWTLAIAFVSEKDGETTVECTAKLFPDCTPEFLDSDGSQWLFDQSETMWGPDTFCSMWISVPANIDDGDSLFEEFDEVLEEAGAYDREAIEKLKDQRKLKASIKEHTNGFTLRDKAHAIAKELQDAGWPIHVRLINIGRYAHSNPDIDDSLYHDVGGSDATLVSVYLDESEVAAEDIKIPETINDEIMAIADRIIAIKTPEPTA